MYVGLIISVEGKVLLNIMSLGNKQVGTREEQSKRNTPPAASSRFLHRPPDATRYTAASGEAHLPRLAAAWC